MNLTDYLVLGGILVALIAALWITIRKKRGGSGCGSCPYSGNCADKNCKRFNVANK